MFIAKYPNGKIITGKEKTWNKIDDGMTILELTIPLKVSYLDPNGNEKIAPARTIALRGYDKYYFHEEALAFIDVNSKNPLNDGKGKKEAQAIIGFKDDIGTMIRVDKNGFIQISQCEEKDFRPSDIKNAG